MRKLIRTVEKKLFRMERGQVLVIVALAAVGIIAIIGLALDVGTLFIGNARLRRAVDSAALAAALQVREGVTLGDLTNAATEFMILNGVTLDASHPITVDTCDTDPDLCHDVVHDTTVPRKLVRVTASATVRLAFLPVIGIDNAPISATATSEAASMDVVLVLDRSESMTNDADLGDPMRDPNYCNEIYDDVNGNGIYDVGVDNAGSCQPFNDVQNAAVDFVRGQLFYYPYDRVAIVTFDKKPSDPPVLHLAEDCPDSSCTAQEIEDHIVATIRNLTVYQGDEDVGGDPPGANAIYPNGNPSRYYGSDVFISNPDPADYLGITCQQIRDDTDPNYPDPSPCTTTNIGQALRVAGNEFAQGIIRQQALWVVVLLTDGMANAGYSDVQGNPETCPRDTWPDIPGRPPIYCNDANSTTRHAVGSEEYDADDYAYDMADFVALPASAGGQYAIMFTIGLGDLMRDDRFKQADNTYPSEEFLKYAATDHIPGEVGRGAYFPASDSTKLPEIFRKIAENIFTKLTH